MIDDWQVPVGFPRSLTDVELEEALQHMAVEPRTQRFANVNTALQAALIGVGVADQQRRHAEVAATASRRIALASVGIAILAVVISVGLGILTYGSDKDWQKQQTKILIEIRNRLPP